jgi:uncharacterized protein (DUF1697 family)
MPQFVVLLRGVNVGKGNRVPMAAFRQLLEGLGGSGVQTLLNSGNAVFSSAGRSAAKHAGAISGALEEQLGVTVRVIVKSADEFQSAVAAFPAELSGKDPSRILVAFAQDNVALTGLAPVQDPAAKSERFTISDHAAYLHCPDGILKSTAGLALLGKPGREVTTRNWATVQKLAALLEPVG